MVYRRRKLATVAGSNGETLDYFEDGLFQLWRDGEAWPISTYGAVGWCVAHRAIDDPEFRKIGGPEFRFQVFERMGDDS